MQRLSVPWGLWYSKAPFEMTFPDEWEIIRCAMRDGPDVSDAQIEEAFLHPIGTQPLSEMAKGRKSAAIAVDDMTRPTQAYRILPILLRHLEKAGLSRKDVTIVIALGAHRSMDKKDMVKKLGEEIVQTMAIYNHHPYEHLLHVGKSSRGTDIYVSRFFADADLKIGLSFITPHPMAGFGGGGKIILPGLGGIDTLEQNHRPGVRGVSGGIGFVEGNEVRAEIEDVARKVGLEFSINVVGNSSAQTAGIFAGDLVAAHRKAVELATRVYATPAPPLLDIGIFNAWPKDSEFLQAVNAFNVWRTGYRDLVRKGGAVIISSACSEGRGFHGLMSKGMRLYMKVNERGHVANIFQDRRVCFFSPNATLPDLRDYYAEEVQLFNEWSSLIEELKRHYPAGSKVGVFPCSTLQYLVES
jgi:nickel-dependent lactate racemase